MRVGAPGLLLLGISLLLGGCGDRFGEGSPSTGDRLLILAASDLILVLPELVAQFEERSGISAEIVLGSSGNLATQIEHGAPADLFLSANRAFVDRLEERGRLVPGSRITYAVGRIVLLVQEGEEPPTGLSALVGLDPSLIALANPEHAPYGVAGREALEAAGIWAELRGRLVFAENVAQVNQMVRTGNVSVGIAALGALSPDREWSYRLIPSDQHQPILQTGGVVQGSEMEEEAAAFLRFVVGEDGQSTLVRFGFEPAPTPADSPELS